MQSLGPPCPQGPCRPFGHVRPPELRLLRVASHAMGWSVHVTHLAVFQTSHAHTFTSKLLAAPQRTADLHLPRAHTCWRTVCFRPRATDKMLGMDMFRGRVPWSMVLVLLLLRFTTTLPHDRTIDFSEQFAGTAVISAACRSLGLRGHSQDVLYSRAMNVLTPAGFALCALSTMRLRPGAILPMGPVCSSWVWMCRKQSRRSFTCPLGDEDAEFVAHGNLMISRVVLLILLAALLEACDS